MRQSLWPALVPALLTCALNVNPAASAVLAATPISRMDLPVWRARYATKQDAIHDGRYQLVYYGDSITQNFERAGKLPQADWPRVWQHFYADRAAFNLGFKGDTTASLLWRIEHGEGDVRGPDGGDPKVAIVLIGANNLGRLHWSPADTLSGIIADVSAIRTHLPRTRILLLGILPSIRSDWATQTTLTVNAELAQHYARADAAVVFMDVGAVLMRGGRPDPGLFIDPLLTPPDPPLHPTTEGQARIARAIEPNLAAMLGDRRH